MRCLLYGCDWCVELSGLEQGSLLTEMSITIEAPTPILLAIPIKRYVIMTRLREFNPRSALAFYTVNATETLELPLFESTVSAGFPSPADDDEEQRLDLNQHLIQHPSATFYAYARGHSMRDAGIHDGDLLVVDRAVRPQDDDVAVCVVDGEFTVKRIRIRDGQMWLQPANPAYEPLPINESHDFRIWGVVTYVVHKF